MFVIDFEPSEFVTAETADPWAAVLIFSASPILLLLNNIVFDYGLWRQA
jgi:hypothetical protein